MFTLSVRLIELFCFALMTVPVFAGEVPDAGATPSPPSALTADAPKAPSDLQRLIAALGTEPLCVVGVQDVKLLPEHFAKTHLHQMLIDPTYVKGLATIKALLNDNTGVDLTEFLLRATKLIDGPAALAVTTGPDGIAYTVFVQAKSEESAKQLASIWPDVKDPTALFSVLKLKTFQANQLPAATATLPDWATKNFLEGDLFVTVYPRKLVKAIEKAIADGKLDTKAKPQALATIYDTGVERMALGIAIDGQSFRDNLTLELAPETDNTFSHVMMALKEKPKGWDSLLAAMPSDGDLVVLMQSDLKAMGADLPYAIEPLERYLRGKKWARKVGITPEALDPKRFDFLVSHLHGEIGISAKPTLTAELHLCLAGALKPGEPDAIRDEFIKGLESLSATFETLQGVPKIGNNSPLGAQFQGRGIFTAPVIGLSPGWSWLCSNLATYQELTSSLAKGRTLANAFKSETARVNAGGAKVELWHPEDALRVQIALERVVQLAYTAWLLSGEDGFIAGWRVPSDMLLPPQLFQGKLGNLRVGMSRSGRTLSAYSHCSIPCVSGLEVLLLGELTAAVDDGRQFAKNPPPPPRERVAPIKQKKTKDDADTDPAPTSGTGMGEEGKQAGKPK